MIESGTISVVYAGRTYEAPYHVAKNMIHVTFDGKTASTGDGSSREFLARDLLRKLLREAHG